MVLILYVFNLWVIFGMTVNHLILCLKPCFLNQEDSKKIDQSNSLDKNGGYLIHRKSNSSSSLIIAYIKVFIFVSSYIVSLVYI